MKPKTSFEADLEGCLGDDLDRHEEEAALAPNGPDPYGPELDLEDELLPFEVHPGVDVHEQYPSK